LIIANDFSYSQLIPPSQVQVHYLKEIYPDSIYQSERQFSKNFLLLEKGKLNKETLNFITNNNRLKVCFEDDEFLFINIEV
jgi:hypothetical protein